jgi:hypothetical protein
MPGKSALTETSIEGWRRTRTVESEQVADCCGLTTAAEIPLESEESDESDESDTTSHHAIAGPDRCSEHRLQGLGEHLTD